MKLVQRVKTKSPSMKGRGVAFAVESIANLKLADASESQLDEID
jgi:hypothetical protein